MCGVCGHGIVGDTEWVGRWWDGSESCDACGASREDSDPPRVTVDPADLALQDSLVARLHWYHTSTQPDWPTTTFNPAAEWGPDSVARMGGSGVVDKWVEQERTKALHVGTYEAAIHNMLRRMDDQGDRENQFYLYRVRLRDDVRVQLGWLPDPGGAWGDVQLNDVCPPNVDVARYVNLHEDVGRLSLALGRGAILGVQKLVIPQFGGVSNSWELDAINAIAQADAVMPDLTPMSSRLAAFRETQPGARRQRAAEEAVHSLSERMPLDLRVRFNDAVRITPDDDRVQWARRVNGLSALILDAPAVLAALDRQELRTL